MSTIHLFNVYLLSKYYLLILTKRFKTKDMLFVGNKFSHKRMNKNHKRKWRYFMCQKVISIKGK